MFKRALFHDVGAVNALGGAGISAALSAGVNLFTKNIIRKGLEREHIRGDFDRAESKRMEGLIRNRGIALIEPEHVLPGIIGTANKNIIKAFKDLPPVEKARELIDMGDKGAFYCNNSITGEPTIYKGPSGTASASTLAHELGHAMNAADVANTILSPIRKGAIALGSHTNWITPVLTGASAVGASDNLLLLGGILGSAIKLPMIADELIASWRGKKFMEANGFKSNSWDTFKGVPTYLQTAITPLLPWLSRKAMRAITDKFIR